MSREIVPDCGRGMAGIVTIENIPDNVHMQTISRGGSKCPWRGLKVEHLGDVLRRDHHEFNLNYQDYQDYQDPSMKIPSWMAIGRGKKQTLINTPSRSSSDDQASS